MLNTVNLRDYMLPHPAKVKADANVLDAMRVIIDNKVSGLCVVDDADNLVGILSELDCLKIALHAGYHGDWGGPVSDYMSDGVRTVDAEMSIIDLAQEFLESKYRRFPVMDKNRLIGQISRRDVLRALELLAKS